MGQRQHVKHLQSGSEKAFREARSRVPCTWIVPKIPQLVRIGLPVKQLALLVTVPERKTPAAIYIARESYRTELTHMNRQFVLLDHYAFTVD